MRRALVLQRLGHARAALDGYRHALAGFRRAGDLTWEAKLLCNRGVLHAYRGAFRAAETDLLRAEHLHTRLGNALAATQVRHNLGFVAARRGDVPAALRRYDRVDDEYQALEVPRALLHLDRCEVLLSVHLVAEARAAATAAVTELARAHLDTDLPSARLTLSEAALLDGDATVARHQAELARRDFARQGRTGWVALARHASVRAAWIAGDPVRARCWQPLRAHPPP